MSLALAEEGCWFDTSASEEDQETTPSFASELVNVALSSRSRERKPW